MKPRDIIAFRASAEERAAMERAAKADGRTLSDWLRLVALKAAKAKGGGK